MAQFDTGYPSLRPGNNLPAYKLGCRLLDLQDRLLVKHQNKHVRAVLQLDLPRQMTELFWLSLELQDAIEGVMNQQAHEQVLRRVARWNDRLQALAISLGL